MADVIPTLEQLMEHFEKHGMEKQASTIRDVLAWLMPRPPQSKTVISDPSEPMLQEGERYEDIDPKTGKATHKRYQMDKPLPVTKLAPYFSKGMHTVDFLQGEYDKETDPVKKNKFKELLDLAVQEEERLRGARMAAQVIVKCAASLRDKGYAALADRLASGIYRPGKGVRIRSFKEYIEESKVKVVDKDTSLYDEMFDKYVRVFKGAIEIVSKAKLDMHNPKGFEDAKKVVLVADQLMMQKLLEVGEVTSTDSL